MITDSLIKGGKERRLLELLRYFEKKDELNVVLILLKDIVDYPIVGEFKRTKIIILKRKIRKDPTIFIRVWKIMKDFRPNLVHSWGSMPSIYVFLSCFIQKIPLLNGMISDTNCKFLSQSWIRAKITFPFSDCVLANSYSGLEAYNVPVSKGVVIYNGVHLDRFVIDKEPDVIREQFNIKTKYVVGMVAAFHSRKDNKTFVKGAIEIVTKRDDVTFVTVGDGPLLNQIKELVPEEYKERILFLGNQDNVEEIISVFDIGVLTAIKEGISNAIVEYMALGKPVIASYGGATPEIVDNGINGFIISTYNVNQLVEKIELLLSNNKMAYEFGRNGHAKIEKAYNIDIMTENYIGLYERLVK